MRQAAEKMMVSQIPELRPQPSQKQRAYQHPSLMFNSDVCLITSLHEQQKQVSARQIGGEDIIMQGPQFIQNFCQLYYYQPDWKDKLLDLVYLSQDLPFKPTYKPAYCASRLAKICSSQMPEVLERFCGIGLLFSRCRYLLLLNTQLEMTLDLINVIINNLDIRLHISGRI